MQSQVKSHPPVWDHAHFKVKLDPDSGIVEQHIDAMHNTIAI